MAGQNVIGIESMPEIQCEIVSGQTLFTENFQQIDPLTTHLCGYVRQQHYCKTNQPIKVDAVTGPTSWKNRFTFVRDPVPDTDSGLLFRYSHHCGIEDVRSSISHTVTDTHSEMTDADTVMNPQRFVSDPVNIPIRIRINPQIRIPIPDHLWFKLDALAEVCALWAHI